MTARRDLEALLACRHPVDVKAAIDAFEREVQRADAAKIRAKTEQLKADGVLEHDKFRPCCDAANQVDPDVNEVEW